MPGNEDEAAALLDAYLLRADSQARLAAVGGGLRAATLSSGEEDVHDDQRANG
jgi:hypothetical protein